MFACAHKSASAASNSAGQSEVPRSKAFHRERKPGFTGTTCERPFAKEPHSGEAGRGMHRRIGEHGSREMKMRPKPH